MPHKSEDFKISVVEYYLDSNKTQDEVCNTFKCSVRSLMRWVERNQNNNTWIFNIKVFFNFSI
jgi:transposase-like protein